MYAGNAVIYVGDKDDIKIERCLSEDLHNISDYYHWNEMINDNQFKLR